MTMECSLSQEFTIESIVKKHECHSRPGTWTTLPSMGFLSRDLSNPLELTEEEDDDASVVSDESDIVSTYGDSEEQEMATTGSEPDDSGLDTSDGMYERIFTNAIAVTQLVEAAIHARSQLPSDKVSASVARVAARLRRVTAAPAAEQDSDDLREVVRLLKSAKMMFDEEVATAKLLAAITVLETRFDRSALCEEAETPEQILLQHEAEFACAEMARLAALLLPEILPSVDAAAAKAGACARLVEECAKLVEEGTSSGALNKVVPLAARVVQQASGCAW